jgi:hypothetical protein
MKFATTLEKELYEALEWYLHARPAFRSMPVGAPGSPARLGQEAAIAAEDKAKAALAKARAALPYTPTNA